jgi:hypothetical protein
MKWMLGLVLGLAVGLMVFSSGCEKNKDPEPSVNVTGNWRLTFDVGYVIAMLFEQESNGTVQGVGQDAGGAPWSFSGKIEENTLTGSMLPKLSLTALVETNAMAGTYRTTDGATGTFTGTRL